MPAAFPCQTHSTKVYPEGPRKGERIRHVKGELCGDRTVSCISGHTRWKLQSKPSVDGLFLQIAKVLHIVAVSIAACRDLFALHGSRGLRCISRASSAGIHDHSNLPEALVVFSCPVLCHLVGTLSIDKIGTKTLLSVGEVANGGPRLDL